jgi:hypothetical protein
MARYEDTCLECGRTFWNSHVQGLTHCSVGCMARATQTREPEGLLAQGPPPDWSALADELAAALLRHIEVYGGADHHPADCDLDAGCVMCPTNRRVSGALAKYDAARGKVGG